LLLGTGATLLQVAGNPIMRDVSPEGKYARNLSFGQFVKAIGSLSTALLPIVAVAYWQLDWRIIFPIYAPIVFITLLYLYFTTIKEESKGNEKAASLSSCLSLLQNRNVTLMVLGIFLYVGAEVTMSARLPNYLAQQFSFDIKTLGLWGTLFFFLALMTGRFLGGVILNWLSPSKFLLITALVSIIGFLVLFAAPNELFGFIAIALIGLGFANIFPLIFSMTVEFFPNRSNEISGLMVTAIIGGAIVPVLFGIVADFFSQITGFLIPMLCLIYIVVLAFLKTKVSHEQS
jgi:fucose permease